MDGPASIFLILTAIAGIASLEMRRAKASALALGAAVGFFAVAMFLAGASEVGIGALFAGAALMMAFTWGFQRTNPNDTLPAVPSGTAGGLAVGALIAFTVAAFFIARIFVGLLPAGVPDAHADGHLGLLREGVVLLAAAAAVWAMLRKSGRRGE